MHKLHEKYVKALTQTSTPPVAQGHITVNYHIYKQYRQYRLKQWHNVVIIKKEKKNRGLVQSYLYSFVNTFLFPLKKKKTDGFGLDIHDGLQS